MDEADTINSQTREPQRRKVDTHKCNYNESDGPMSRKQHLTPIHSINNASIVKPVKSEFEIYLTIKRQWKRRRD